MGENSTEIRGSKYFVDVRLQLLRGLRWRYDHFECLIFEMK